MKDRIAWSRSLGLALALLPLAAGCVQEASSSPEQTGAAMPPELSTNAAVQPVAAEAAPLADQLPFGDPADAPVTPVSMEKTVPPNVKPTPAVSEVIQLAQSGVDEGVMLAFVANSSGTFNLRADEIIYLNDIGIPGNVVTAMIGRDEQLKQLSVSGMTTAAPPPGPTADQAPAMADAPPPYAAAPAPPADYPTESYAPPPEDAAYPAFYDALAPYGTWVDVGGYGRCWQPTMVVVNAGWQPYFDGGRWVYTDCGWYWMSDYSWGWAPFHYGRWFRHNYLGWCWMPDRVWGPSWVSWRHTDGYCGWAPLPPAARFTVSAGLTLHGRSVSSTFAFGLRPDHYRFIPLNHFQDHHLNHFALSREEAGGIYRKTVVTTSIVGSHNMVINNGISPESVAAATRTTVPKVALHDVSATGVNGVRAERLEGNGKALAVYRPRLPEHPQTQAALADRSRTGGGATTALGGHGSPSHLPQPLVAAKSVTQPGPTGRTLERNSDLRPVPGHLAASVAPATSAQAVAGRTAAAQPGPATSLATPYPDRRQRSAPTLGQSLPNQQLTTWPRPASPGTTWARTEYSTVRDANTAAHPGQRPPLILRGPDRPDQVPQSQAGWVAQGSVNASQEPRYQAPARSASAEVPRYAPAPAYNSPPWSSGSGYQAAARPAPAEVSRYAPAPVERSHYDSAPSQAPQRSYSASVASESSSHSQSSSDRSSDRGSRNGR